MIFTIINCMITVERKTQNSVNSAGEPDFYSNPLTVIYTNIPAYLDVRSGSMQYGVTGENQFYNEVLYIQPRYIVDSLLPQDIVTTNLDSLTREVIAVIPKSKMDRNIDIYEVFLKILP